MSKTITITECAEFLSGRDGFLVITHRKPDGDAIGCGGALVRLLRKAGKHAYLFKNPEITDRYMPFAEGLFAPENLPLENIVTVDCASVSQLCAGAEIFSDKIGLAIDHHMSNTGYADNLCLDDRAACGEIILALAEEMGIALDKKIADALYTAISTDTGCFCYGNTTENSLYSAAKLVSAGADIASLNKILFRTKRKSRAMLEGYLYSTMNYYFDDTVAVCKIGLDARREYGVTEDDLDSIASLPTEIEGVIAGITIKEQADKSSKISVRTDGKVNASDLCAVFGGGGHIQAAGCNIDAPMDEAEKAIITAMRDILC